jgi:autotransporter translocation and assembly factor TamB
MQRLRTVLRILLRVLLAVVALLLVLGVTLFLLGRSSWGQQKLLSVLLPVINRALTGRLQVGALHTDLLHMLVLDQVELYDAEQQLAVRAEHVGLRYNLLTLWSQRLDLSAVDITGGYVHGRRLRDGRLNLATLVRPTPPPTDPKPLALRIEVGGITADVDFQLDASQPLRAQLHLEGAAQYLDPKLSVQLQTLRVQTSQPLKAALQLQGGLEKDGASTTLKDVKLSGTLQAEQLQQLLHQSQLQGELALSVSAAGPLQAVAVDTQLQLPKGTLTLQTQLNALNPLASWQVKTQLRGFEPAAMLKNAPDGTVNWQASASGQGLRGQLQLAELAVALRDIKLQASGAVQGDAQAPDLAHTTAQLAVQVDITQLSQVAQLLAQYGVTGPPLAGKLQGKTSLQLLAGQLRLDGDVNGQALQLAGLRAQRLALQLHTVDLTGKVSLQASGLAGLPLGISQVTVSADGSRQLLAVRAAGQAAEQRQFALQLTGRPTFKGSALQSVQAQLSELRLQQRQDVLQLQSPAQVAVDLVHAAGPILDLQQVALRFGEQHVKLDAHVELKSKRLRVSLDGTALDLGGLSALVGVSTVPKTQLTLHAQLAGTWLSPTGNIELSGSTQAAPALHLPATQLELHTKLGAQRAQGELTLQLVDAKDPAKVPPKLTLQFDAATQGTLQKPLHLKLEAQARSESLVAYLPPQLASLQGGWQLTASLDGTLQHPELQLKLMTPEWQLESLQGQPSELTLTYNGATAAAGTAPRLSASLHTTLQTLRHEPVALVSASVELPLKLDLGLTAESLRRQVLSAPLKADAAITQVQLPQVLRLTDETNEPPLQQGELDLTLHALGTVTAPAVELKLDARKLAAGPIKELSLALLGSYHPQDAQLRLDLSAGLPQGKLLTGQAQTTLPLAPLLAGAGLDWKKQLVTANLQLLPLELSTLSPIKGQLTGTIDFRGSAAKPTLTAHLASPSLEVHHFVVGPLKGELTMDEQQQVGVTFSALQPAHGGLLLITSQLKLPIEPATLSATLKAKDFRVNYDPGQVSDGLPFKMARGRLDADLQVKGAAGQPQAQGFLKLSDGSLLLSALPQLLSQVQLDVAVTTLGDLCTLTLRQLKASADTGRLTADGEVQLIDRRLKQVELKAQTQAFPVAAGSLGIWLDAQLKVHGNSDGKIFKSLVDIPSMSVRLPKLSSGQSLQSLEPLEDVKFVDRAARQAAAKLQAEKEAAAEKARLHAAAGPSAPSAFLPPQLEVTVQLPPALRVVGPELNTDLSGQLQLTRDTRDSDDLHITGEISTAAGWVEILSRRYQLERAQISLSGQVPPNPLLDVQIARKLDDATIYIQVTGSARKPVISFRSDPPIYDRSQIMTIILTGQGGSGSISQQAMGVLSSLVVDQLKSQLAGGLPIDVIKFDVAGADPLGLGQSSLEVGKYLRDDLYLGYMHRFGGATTGMRRLNIDQVRLEYRFLQKFQLTTVYGDANVGSIDLSWTKRF